MVRITVLVILLSVFLGIHAGIIGHEEQANNVTRLEKRYPMFKKIKKGRKPAKTNFDCNTAIYQIDTLSDFVNKHNCFPNGWKKFLEIPEVQNAIKVLSGKLFQEAMYSEIEPLMPNMFKAFTVPLGQVKVVIIGQDPVPQKGKATGLAFSLQPGANPRDVPTVYNMLVELKLEGMDVDLSNGDLSPWLKQGVLLLNSALTVPQGTSKENAGKHIEMWEDFMELLVKHISDNNQPKAWILWGNEAKAFAGLIDTSRHYIKAGEHPSPTGWSSHRFFGRNYFKCANEFLKENPPLKPRREVDWSLPYQAIIGKQPGDCDENGLWS